MQKVETIQRGATLAKTFRGRKAAEIFAAHPTINTVEIYKRGGVDRIGCPTASVAYYVMSTSGKWGKSSELRLPPTKEAEEPEAA